MKIVSNASDSIKLDIACGKNKKLGFVGVDLWDGADVICDLEKFPWPFDDDSVDEIFCSHYIEHTPNLIAFANELYRIMKVGAKAEIIAPYYSSIRAWQDPTHLRAISEATFLYFSKDWRTLNKLDHYPISVDFDAECKFIIDPLWRDKDDEELKFAIRHYINVVSDIHVVLTKRKLVDDKLCNQLRQAEACWEDGDFESAASICRKIIDIEDNLDALLMIGEYELRKDNFTGAITIFSKVLKIDAQSFEGHAGLVRALVGSDQLEQAKLYIKELNNTDAGTALLLEIYLPSN